MAGAKALAVGLAACGAVVSSATPSAAEPAPLILFAGPDAPTSSISGARTALEGVAQRRATALLDLSPRPPAPSRAPGLLRAAIEAYHAFKYNIALDAVGKGLAEVRSTGGRGLTTRELAELYLYRALVQTARGDATAAWDDFVRSAVIDPSRHLDPVRFPPRVIESYQRAVQAVQKGGHGALKLSLPASGCKVWIDGRSAALLTPALPWGDHYVAVTCAGYAPYGAKINISAAQLALAPALEKRAPVSVQRAASVARIRGATRFLFAEVLTSGGLPPTMRLRLFETRRMRERAQVVLRLGGGTDVGAVAERMIDRLSHSPPIVKILPPRTPWYRKPWVWGVAGAAVTAAVLIPFLVDAPPPSGFDVTLRGAVP